MSSKKPSLVASPTLGRPEEGAQSPGSWRLDKGPFSALHNVPLCPSEGGGTMQRWPGEAEDKGPFVAPSPPERQCPGSHLAAAQPSSPPAPALLPLLGALNGCVGSWPTAGGDKAGWGKCGIQGPLRERRTHRRPPDAHISATVDADQACVPFRPLYREGPGGRAPRQGSAQEAPATVAEAVNERAGGAGARLYRLPRAYAAGPSGARGNGPGARPRPAGLASGVGGASRRGGARGAPAHAPCWPSDGGAQGVAEETQGWGWGPGARGSAGAGARPQGPPGRLRAGTFWLTRIVLLRALAFVYFVAFLVAFHQNKQLIGDRGLLPCRAYLQSVQRHFGGRVSWDALSYAPTILWLLDWSHMDANLDALALLGLGISSFILVSGCANMVLMAALWVLYMSLVNVGQIWYSFGKWRSHNPGVGCSRQWVSSPAAAPAASGLSPHPQSPPNEARCRLTPLPITPPMLAVGTQPASRMSTLAFLLVTEGPWCPAGRPSLPGVHGDTPEDAGFLGPHRLGSSWVSAGDCGSHCALWVAPPHGPPSWQKCRAWGVWPVWTPIL
ncbi:uncharacterized protein [Bos mutus]|uniref:uncharacterized protein n=1 Tax=Bos mutus TaxID=72004 RepID=UPI0038B47A79